MQILANLCTFSLENYWLVSTYNYHEQQDRYLAGIFRKAGLQITKLRGNAVNLLTTRAKKEK